MQEKGAGARAREKEKDRKEVWGERRGGGRNRKRERERRGGGRERRKSHTYPTRWCSLKTRSRGEEGDEERRIRKTSSSLSQKSKRVLKNGQRIKWGKGFPRYVRRKLYSISNEEKKIWKRCACTRKKSFDKFDLLLMVAIVSWS